jgi:predicted dehydrogenase
MAKPIPVILAGYGECARSYTVMPLLKRFPGMMQVVGITSLLAGEFEEFVVPEFRKNGWPVPTLIDDFEDACDKRYFKTETPLAMLVTTPNGLHFGQARMAIEAGYNVYVERPIVTASDDLPTLVELADRHEVLLITGTQRRLEDPFQYLQNVVVHNCCFDQLKRIRCHFAVKHHLEDWRRRSDIAGGGIVIDSGYHLLDIAAWLLDSIGIEIPQRLQGAVHFSFHEPHPSSDEPCDVETEAVGYVELPNDILLTLDFTYNTPENTVSEQIELTDQSGARIRLTRDQAPRTSLPGTITHQLPNGKFAEVRAFNIGRGVRAEAIRFSGEIQTVKPLWMFVEAVKEGYNKAQGTEIVQARASISVWRLVREIYRLAMFKERKRESELT